MTAYRLPDFLIVGAMKAGTTTLFRDLSLSRRIFFPIDKEPNCLSFDEVLTSSGTMKYGSLFRSAGRHSICGEASTMYTMAPLFNGAPKRASQVIGSRLKIIYMVRDPFSRLISHYRHWYQSGRAGKDINREVIECQYYVEFSKYHRQLREWIDYFGPESVRVVSLEQYAQRRQEICGQLLGFVGAQGVESIPERAYNVAADLGHLSNAGRSISSSKIYRRVVRSMVPQSLRSSIAKVFIQKREPVRTELSVEVICRVYEQLHEDAARLADIWSVRLMDYDLSAAIDRFCRSS